MTREDIAAYNANRKSTLRSIKAKRESRIKAIQERAIQEIQQVTIQYAADPERLRAKYAADALYKSERAKRKAERRQKREEQLVARAVKEHVIRNYSFGEELFNSITLGIGAGLSIAAIVLFVLRAVMCAPSYIFGRTVTGFALVGAFLFLTYLMSTLAHALKPYIAKYVFRKLAYSMGFTCYTSVLSLCALTFIRGKEGWTLFGIDGALCLCAVIAWTTFSERLRVRALKIICALMFGALIVQLVMLLDGYPVICFKLLVTAFVTYIIGELFHAMKNIKWTNPVFHLFNLLANIFIFFSLYLAVADL